MGSERWMRGTIQWSWAIRSLKRNRDALSSCWWMVCNLWTFSFLLELANIVCQETLVTMLRLLPQFVRVSLRKRQVWTLTSTRMARAPSWGAPPMDFPHLCASSGSGCPKRTAQRPSCRSPFSSSVCMCVRRKRRGGTLLLFTSGHMSLSDLLSTGCLFRWGKAAFGMLTKTREETMRAHSDPDADQRIWFHSRDNVHF